MLIQPPPSKGRVTLKFKFVTQISMVRYLHNVSPRILTDIMY